MSDLGGKKKRTTDRCSSGQRWKTIWLPRNNVRKCPSTNREVHSVGNGRTRSAIFPSDALMYAYCSNICLFIFQLHFYVR